MESCLINLVFVECQAWIIGIIIYLPISILIIESKKKKSADIETRKKRRD